MVSETARDALFTLEQLRVDPSDDDLFENLWVLEADDPDVRMEAADVIGGLAADQPELVGRHYDELVEAMWEPLNDDDWRVVSNATFALGELVRAAEDIDADVDTETYVQMLAATLTSPNADNRFMAASALGLVAETYPELVRPHLDALDRALEDYEGLDTGEPGETGYADPIGRAIGNVAEEYPEVLDDDQAIERILSTAEDHPHTHLFYTAGMIAAVRPSAVEPYVEDWVEMLDAEETPRGGMGDIYDFETEREQRAAAAGIEAIASHEPSLLEPHLPRLISTLETSEPAHLPREDLARAIGDIASHEPSLLESHLPRLISTLRTSESAHLPREDLARALGDVGDPAALDALRWLRDNDDAPYIDSGVRAAAEEAIQKIGPKADESSPVAYVHEGEGDVVAGDQSKAVDQRTTVEDSVINRSNVGTSSPESDQDQDQDDGTDISFCPSCGTDLSEWDVPAFCPSCGSEL